MITERLQKSREFIEAECVKAASAQNLCRELKHIRIRRLFPKGADGKLGTCRIRTRSIDGRRMCGAKGD